MSIALVAEYGLIICILFFAIVGSFPSPLRSPLGFY